MRSAENGLLHAYHHFLEQPLAFGVQAAAYLKSDE
jgi:hypothetical protein